MKRISVILYFLCIAFTITAQKTWDSGALTWNDFKGKEYSGSLYSTELYYFIGYKTVKEKFNDTTVNYFKAYCYVDTASSWVNTNEKSEQNLLYNQIMFDIVELHKRILQQDIFILNHPYEIEQKLRTHIMLCNTEVNQLKSETNYGQNKEQLIVWDIKINDRLKNSRQHKIPHFECGNFSYGMSWGLGYTVLSGTVAQHFSNATGLSFGFNLGYKKTAIFFNGTLAFNSVKSNYQGRQLWTKSLPTNITIMDISIGQSIFENTKLNILPFIGIGVVEISRKYDANNSKGALFESYNYTFGVACDYTIKKHLQLVDVSVFTNRKEYSLSNIRTRIFVNPINYASDLKGTAVSIGITYSNFGRFVK